MLDPETGKFLRDTAIKLRKQVLTTIHLAGDGHPAPALSVADIVTVLYYHAMRIDPANPHWPDRDRFILSKGHACTILYSALADLGYFPADLLPTFRSLGSILQGHPVMNKTPGIDMTTGSLGHGLPVGAGMAAAGRLAGKDYRVYVVLGDGELNEGIVWEGAMIAANMKLSNLTAFVDANGYQSGGHVCDVSGMRDIASRFESFGWNCLEIDGHDLDQIAGAIDAARAETGVPTMIVARTVKGKGISFMEGNNAWHKGVPTREQLETAFRDLEAGK